MPAGDTDVLATDCSSDAACDDHNPCTIDRCAEQVCVRTPVKRGAPCAVGVSASCDGSTWSVPDLCDDDGQCVDSGIQDCAFGLSQCELATCDDALGCGAKPKRAGTPCVGEDGASDSCDGTALYHRPDACDTAGVCVDGGVDTCPSGDCVDVTCAPGVGCSGAPRDDGTPCEEGLSAACGDGAYHAADACVGGQCVDGAVTECADSFCQVGSCGVGGCRTTPVGTGLFLGGPWSFVTLRVEGDDAVGLKGALSFNAGLWTQTDLLASQASTGWATSGAYCVSDDGALQLAVAQGTSGGVTTEYAGQVSADGQVFAATALSRAELVVGVKRAAVGSAELGANWRVVGLVRDDAGALVALSGWIIIDADGCATAFDLKRSDGAVAGGLTSSPSCAAVDELGKVELALNGPEAVLPTRSWRGQLSVDQGFMLLSPTSTADGRPLPGVMTLMRENSAVNTAAIDGEYALASFGMESDALASARGTLDYRGADGHIGDIGLASSSGAWLEAGGTPLDIFALSVRAIHGKWGMLRQNVVGDIGTLDWNGQAGPVGVGGKVSYATVYDGGREGDYGTAPTRTWFGLLIRKP